MVGGSGQKDWDALLDRLSACITPQEAAAVRQAAVDRGSPSHLRQLHNLVAGLLVKHRLTTWPQLHTSFPGYGTHGRECGSGAAGMEDGGYGTEGSAAGNGAAGPPKGGKSPTEVDGQGESGRGEKQGGGSTRMAGLVSDRAEMSSSRSQGSCADMAGNHISGRKRRPEAQPHVAQTRAKLAAAGSTHDPGGSMYSILTLADYPRVVSWWHPTKNGDKVPADYTHGSSQRVWLQCSGCPDCGEVHQWDAKAYSLTKREFGCPSCTTKGGPGAVCSCRAISANERLASEWHEDNPSPATVHLGSHKRYKWRCADAACGHVWVAQPYNRSRAGGISGTSCPACYERRCMKHPSVAVGRPDLLDEWDYERNAPLLASEVRCGSNKKVWWLCKVCKRSWQATIHHRAAGGTGCPKCRKSK